MENQIFIEVAGFILAVATSVVVTGISYGVLKEKVRVLETTLERAVLESRADRKDLREEQKSFVTYNHFEVVLQPIRATLNELKSDAKEILRRIGHQEE